VTLLVPDPNGPNDVEVTLQDDIANAGGDITGKKMLVTLKRVDHEIKCKGEPSSSKCSATVVWDVPNTTFKFEAKGQAWNGKAAKDAKGEVNYTERSIPQSQVDIEGSCDPKLKLPARTIYVRLVLIVTYPDELVAELKRAKAAGKTKVTVGKITGSVTWSTKAGNCPTRSFIVRGRRRIDPGGALITQFTITGDTY
jgi:hypothetical protein